MIEYGRKVDPLSEKLFRWAKKQIRTKKGFKELKNEVLDKIIYLYGFMPDEELRRLLVLKMQAGSKEHGKPSENLSQLDQEFLAEAIDLLGWTLVRKYMEEKLE